MLRCTDPEARGRLRCNPSAHHTLQLKPGGGGGEEKRKEEKEAKTGSSNNMRMKNSEGGGGDGRNDVQKRNSSLPVERMGIKK